ncbi:hypothetical protein H9P43_001556 [Blastocladiella emersonii ATCC 22665]|nr:hypothetical protein H9P43_001556 [Blastocladiella emersonii ATCC 22665]
MSILMHHAAFVPATAPPAAAGPTAAPPAVVSGFALPPSPSSPPRRPRSIDTAINMSDLELPRTPTSAAAVDRGLAHPAALASTPSSGVTAAAASTTPLLVPASPTTPGSYASLADLIPDLDEPAQPPSRLARWRDAVRGRVAKVLGSSRDSTIVVGERSPLLPQHRLLVVPDAAAGAFPYYKPDDDGAVRGGSGGHDNSLASRLARGTQCCIAVIGVLVLLLLGAAVLATLFVLLTARIMRAPTSPWHPGAPQRCLTPRPSWPDQVPVAVQGLAHLRVTAQGPGTIHLHQAPRGIAVASVTATCTDASGAVAAAVVDVDLQHSGSHVVVKLHRAAVLGAPAANATDDAATCPAIACSAPHWMLAVPASPGLSLAIDEERPGTPAPILFAAVPSDDQTRPALQPHDAATAPDGALHMVVHSAPALADLALTTRSGSVAVRTVLDAIPRGVRVTAGSAVTVAGIAATSGDVRVQAVAGPVRIDRLVLGHREGPRTVAVTAVAGTVHVGVDASALDREDEDVGADAVPSLTPLKPTALDLTLRAPRSRVVLVPFTDRAAARLARADWTVAAETEQRGRIGARPAVAAKSESAAAPVAAASERLELVSLHGDVDLWMA